MSKKLHMRLCADGFWIWTFDRYVFGIGIFVLLYRLRDHGAGVLVPEQKIIGINLSIAE